VKHLAQRLRKDSRLVGLAAAAIAVVIGGVVLRGATGATTTTTFTALADSYVRSDQVNTNFGSANRLNVRASSPTEVSYVRFNVQGLVGVMGTATLRLWAANASSVGFDVRRVADTTWGEGSITYANAPPAASSVTGSSGSFTSGKWVPVNVTPLVSGDGLVSFAVTTASSTEIQLNSREVGARAPQLVVTMTTTPPTNTSLPMISGTARDGQTLSADPGSWSGTQPISFAYQWRRCGRGGGSCSNIAGATGQNYAVASADVGSTLRVVVTGSNVAGSSKATSAQTAVVAGNPPVNTSAPTISGTARDGQTLTADAGTWSGSQPISFAYQWRRCDGAGANCANVAGATGSTYVLVSADVGSTLRVAVTASNVAGSSAATSAQTAAVVGSPPVNTTAPAISGTARDGQTLTASSGTWSGTPPISFAYQWRRCDGGGANCVDVAGANGSAYVVVSADVGSTLRVMVTGSNLAGSSAATSTQTVVVVGNPPVNTAVPTVSGNPQVGQTLSADPGTWSGTQPISFAYQWRRCDSGGAACADIATASGLSYTLGAADVGSTIRVVVTASNSGGSSSATSTQTLVVAGDPPVNTAVPAVSGTATDGQTLSADPGTWSGTQPIAFAYQWRRCDAGSGACSDIVGATAQTYGLVSIDVGSTIRVAVTASNVAGSAGATSTSTSVVTGAPANTSAPTISGTAQVGQTLTADPGTWSGTQPISFAYQWRRCDSGGAGCVDIGGVGGASYVVSADDVGSRIRAAVTATNSFGFAGATSAASAVVGTPPVAPSNSSSPTISGTASDGQTLSADPGVWSGSQPISFAYQWRRCDSDGAACVDVGGASGQSYLVGSADVGSTLRVLVTGSNVAGSSAATSAQTVVVVGNPPVNTAVPTVSGSAQVGQTLSADPATWSGTQPISFAYQWRRCDSGGANCVNIDTAVSQTYGLTSADVGWTLRVAVTASNSVGSATGVSAQTLVVSALPVAPSNSSPPVISGTAQVGQTLSADPGTWSGTLPISFAYQWRRCDGAGANCIDLIPMNGQSYTLTSGDLGATIRLAVTASNSGGSSGAVSAQTAVVTAAPANTSLPSISGTAQVGQTLTADPGTWSGTQPISYAYQWQRCDGSGNNCSAVTGATTQSYVVSSADSSATLRVVVTASNSAGSSSATSAPTAVVGVAPSNTSPPTATGTAQVAQILSGSPGTWSGTQPISFGYQWRRCDSAGANCSNITGANAQTYTLTQSDVSSTVRVVVTASNSAGSSAATSAQTAVVTTAAGCAPRSSSYSNAVLATSGLVGYWRLGETSGTVGCDSTFANNGTYQPGTTLGQAGALVNDPDTAVAFNGSSGFVQVPDSSSLDVGDVFSVEAWVKRGTLSNANNYVIASKQSNAWVLWLVNGFLVLRKSGVADVAASTVAVADTAWHQVAATKNGSTVKLYVDGRDVTGAVNNQAMQNNTSPFVIGQSSSASYFNGTIDEVAVYNVALTGAQVAGHYAVNVPSQSPANTSPPTISGNAQAGQTLTANPGGWSGTPPIAFGYQWRRCDDTGASCQDIAGATAQTYLLTTSDPGSTIRVNVTASNAAGSTSATSAQSAVVGPGQTCAPRSSTYSTAVLGTVGVMGYWRLGEASGVVACDSKGTNFGVYQNGTTLNVPGPLSNDPDTAAAFNGSSGWVRIAHDSSLNVGDRFSVEAWVKRGSLGGSGSQVIASKQDGSWVLMFNPGNQLVLRRSGIGDVATSTATVTDTTAWHYVVATKDGADVKLYLDGADVTGTVSNETMIDNAIPLAIGQSSGAAFFNGAIDEIALYNIALTQSQVSNHYSTGVAVPPPANISPPTIGGALQDGQTLTANPGTWSGTPPLSYTYQWRRCGGGGAVCVDVAGAVGATYTLTHADVGASMRVLVTATNPSGSGSAGSSATTAIAAVSSPPGDPVLAAAGDIACDPTASGFNGEQGTPTACQQLATSNLLVGRDYAAVLPLGDNQYECGGFNAFQQVYDPTWGRLKSISHPVPGNHEYLTSGGTDCDASGGAGGYFQYFGAAAGDPTKGYYSFDVGSWHLIALNSNCFAVGGCGIGSPQETWLQSDLALHPASCTLAYWHHPRFNTDDNGDTPEVDVLWRDLQNAGADVVLNGHAHAYERFAPQNANQNYDPSAGIRELVVGTGGEDFHSLTGTKPLVETQQNNTFGILELTLHPTSYDWRFVPAAGGSYTDSGSTFCH
jgi:hypothetical protein